MNISLRSHRIFVECQWFLDQCSDHRSDKQKVVLHRRRAVNLNGFSLGHDLARVAGGAGPSYPRDHLGWIVQWACVTANPTGSPYSLNLCFLGSGMKWNLAIFVSARKSSGPRFFGECQEPGQWNKPSALRLVVELLALFLAPALLEIGPAGIGLAGNSCRQQRQEYRCDDSPCCHEVPLRVR